MQKKCNNYPTFSLITNLFSNILCKGPIGMYARLLMACGPALSTLVWTWVLSLDPIGRMWASAWPNIFSIKDCIYFVKCEWSEHVLTFRPVSGTGHQQLNIGPVTKWWARSTFGPTRQCFDVAALDPGQIGPNSSRPVYLIVILIFQPGSILVALKWSLGPKHLQNIISCVNTLKIFIRAITLAVTHA